jgi:hypothetical protein
VQSKPRPAWLTRAQRAGLRNRSGSAPECEHEELKIFVHAAAKGRRCEDRGAAWRLRWCARRNPRRREVSASRSPLAHTRARRPHTAERRADWEKRREGLAKLRELADGQASAEWVAERVGSLVPYLVDMLKELRSALLLDCCSTISQLMQRLKEEPHFLRELPKLFVEVMNLPSSNAVIFAAGNQTLQTVIDCTTNSRLMGVVEEACANRHNHRQRARGIDCALRMLLRWPVAKLRRHELALEGALRAGCKDANAHVRASARRGAAAMVLLLPKAGQRLLDEVEPGTADLVMAEVEWVEQQRQSCTFGVGDGAAPVHTEETISAPQLPEGFDPKRVDFRPPGGGPTEDEDRAKRKESSGVTSFQMRQLVKGLPVYLRNILAMAGSRLKTEFEQFDTNGDGVVDPDEMRTGLNGMNLGLSPQDIEAIINVVNVHDDGAVDYAEFAMLFGKRDIPIPNKDGGFIPTSAARPYEFTQVDQPVLQSYHAPEWLSVDEERKMKGRGRPEKVIRHGGHRETLFGDGKPTMAQKPRQGPEAPRKSQNRVRGTDGAGSLAISSGAVEPTPPQALPPSSGRRGGRLLTGTGTATGTGAGTEQPNDGATGTDGRLALLQSVDRTGAARASVSPDRGARDGIPAALAEPPTPKMPMPHMPRYQQQQQQQQHLPMIPIGPPQSGMPFLHPAQQQQQQQQQPPMYGQQPHYGQQLFYPQQAGPQQPQQQYPVQHVQVQQYAPQQQSQVQPPQQVAHGGSHRNYPQQTQPHYGGIVAGPPPPPPSGQYQFALHQPVPTAGSGQQPLAIGHASVHPHAPPGSGSTAAAGGFNETFRSQMSELSGQEQRLQNEIKQMDGKRKVKAGGGGKARKGGAAKRGQAGGMGEPQPGSARFGRRAAAAQPTA